MVGGIHTVRNWQGKFERDWVKVPGQHLIAYGQTGAGKTTVMYWQAEAIREKAPEDTIVWFAIAKASEEATLLSMGPVRFLIPKGCKFEVIPGPAMKAGCGTRMDGIPYMVHEYEIVEYEDPADPWSQLRKGWINIICLYGFIIDPVVYAKVVAACFKNLIYRAHFRTILTPISIFIDEMHIVAPAAGHGVNPEHYTAAAIVQLNIDKLRAMGIRLDGASQGVTKLRKGVRSAFNWQIIKRGANFSKGEEPKLALFNRLWQRLEDHEFILVFPNKQFSDVIQIPFYPRGEEIAVLNYLSLFDTYQEDKKPTKQKYGNNSGILGECS